MATKEESRMASIEFIKNRVSGKEKEIDKLEKKLARIRKAEATGWEINPYYYHEDDLHRALRDLEAAKQALDKYRADLATALEKSNSRTVAAILTFLDKWKKRCTEFYREGLREYYDEKARVGRLYNAYSGCRYGSPEYEQGKAAFTAARGWSTALRA